MSTAEQVLDRLDKALNEIHAASAAVIQFSRRQLEDTKARGEDDDDWRRLPTPTQRCPLSRWSRTTLNRRIDAGDVRRKRIGRMTYYSGADVRAWLAKQP